jgi:excisionase family DNA binding protein
MSGPAEQKSPSQLASANWPKNKKRVPTAETLLTVSQVADNWQVSQRTVRRMIADGRLQIVRLGRARSYPDEGRCTMSRSSSEPIENFHQQ